MEKILFSSFDMSVGGVERSLAGLLENFNYNKYEVDLMLYRHQGEFMTLLPSGPKLLTEIPEYSTFRKGIYEIIKEGQFGIAISRVFARYLAKMLSHLYKYDEPDYYQMQLGWKIALPFLPRLKNEYDIAISYLWPHYFVGEKVNAKKKIAWIHTDYSTIEIDNKIDADMWEKFNCIVAVSDSCKMAFLKKYPQFEDRTVVIENITSADLIKKLSEVDCCTEIEENDNFIKIVTVARLAYQKGIDDAVKACRKLIDEGYHIKWYVVGYGWEENSIKELINSLKIQNHFILLGKKINPYPYIKACDIYAQPSRYEGKAITVTEAKILGKSVIITDFPTAKSQIDDGVDGFICPMGVDGITKGIKKLIDDNEFRNRLSNNASQKNYGNEHEVEKVYKLLMG